MIFSKGFIYRMGIRIKDCGQRISHIKVFGRFIFGRLANPIISNGLKIKDSVLRGATIADMKA